jgi:hypothetical protein
MPTYPDPNAPAGPSYLEVVEATALAADLPALSAWAGATDPDRGAALELATLDVDAAMPYQGRRYDPAQVRQFPRIAEDAPPTSSTDAIIVVPAGDAVVWDWDSATNQPVVPRDVKLAVLFQADSLLANTREPRLSAQHDGVVYQLTGTLAESYKQTPGSGVRTGLCRRAWVMLRKYRLRGGRIE